MAFGLDVPTLLDDANNTNSTHDCRERYKVKTFSAIAFSLGLNSLTLLTALVVLGFALRTQRGRRLFGPRLAEGEFWAFPFGWMRLALARDQIRDEVGLDAMVTIRFLDLGLKFCLVGSLLSIVLVPMYAFSEHTDHHGNFARFSLSNIDSEKGPLKFHIVVTCAYLLNIAFIHLMVGEWQNFVNIRRKQFKQSVLGLSGPGAAQAIRSILVENMPKDYCSADKLFEYFEKQFGEGSVHSAVVQSDTSDLHQIENCCPCWYLKASERITKIRGNLRADVATGIELSSFTEQQPRRGRRTTVAVDERSILAGVNLQSAAKEISRNVGNNIKVVASTVSKALPGKELVKKSSCTTGFVTFQLVQTRVMAEQVLPSHRSNWHIRSAPEARDLVWSNASMPFKLISARNVVSQCVCLLGVLFWSVPVSTIQVWANEPTLRKFFPTLFEISHSSCKLCSTFLLKYVPVVTLILLLALLPIIFEAMTRRYERQKVKSDIHRIVLNRYMAYLLATLYVAVVSGSVSETFETLEKVLREPPQALEQVKEAVPTVAVYFITFVLARTGITIPILLFYPGLFPASGCYFATEASDAALILVLGLTYSAIAPLILPACAAYFAVTSVVYRWLFLYVYEQEFDCAGSFWYDLFNYSVWGMFFSNLILVSLAGGHLRLNSYGFYATAALPLTTLAFKAICEHRYARPSRAVALEDAVEADRQAEEEAQVCLDYNYYVDPVLSSYSPCSSGSPGAPSPSWRARLAESFGA
ncbi:unnamed protein product [Durusdinium trenchii]|uniref:CSC1/OSCA1-like 7TM region domain-containing protein n=1 Tax=Durusdinium trenchii TaxID=1381693 RepID=A0ABP0I534_9DINO